MHLSSAEDKMLPTLYPSFQRLSPLVLWSLDRSIVSCQRLHGFSIFSVSQSPSLLGRSHYHLIMISYVILRKPSWPFPSPSNFYYSLYSLLLPRIIYSYCCNFASFIFFLVCPIVAFASNIMWLLLSESLRFCGNSRPTRCLPVRSDLLAEFTVAEPIFWNALLSLWVFLLVSSSFALGWLHPFPWLNAFSFSFSLP